MALNPAWNEAMLGTGLGEPFWPLVVGGAAGCQPPTPEVLRIGAALWSGTNPWVTIMTVLSAFLQWAPC